MKSLRLIWIGSALLRLATLAVKTSLTLTLLMLLSAASPGAFAQDQGQGNDQGQGQGNDQDQGQGQGNEKTFADSYTPLVYNVENTGANFPAPTFPSFAKLPIIRPLPDPFLFADGDRSTDFTSWERRRNEIFHAVEDNILGPKPDCHDCTITANYAQDPTNALQGTLTVNVTRNGQTMTETAPVALPSPGSGPFPYVIGIGGSGTGSLPASLFTNVATVAFNQNQVTTLGTLSPQMGSTSFIPTCAPDQHAPWLLTMGKGGVTRGNTLHGPGE